MIGSCSMMRQLEELNVAPEWVKPVIPRVGTSRQTSLNAMTGGNPLIQPHLWLIDTEEPLKSIDDVR